MSVALKIKNYTEFFDSPKSTLFMDQYLEEMCERPVDQEMRNQVKVALQDKEFFEIEKDDGVIGFGAFGYEILEGNLALLLEEFYIEPKHRDITQLFNIKKNIIQMIRMFEIAMWACCVDNKDLGTQNAYERLGFHPLFDYDGLTYMGMQVEGL